MPRIAVSIVYLILYMEPASDVFWEQGTVILNLTMYDIHCKVHIHMASLYINGTENGSAILTCYLAGIAISAPAPIVIRML